MTGLAVAVTVAAVITAPAPQAECPPSRPAKLIKFCLARGQPIEARPVETADAAALLATR